MTLSEDREIAEREFRALGPPGRSSSWWGLSVGMVSLSTILAALVYAYAYLWVSADGWPPEGVDPPVMGGSLVALGLLAAGCAVWVGAWRGGGGWRLPALAGIVFGAAFAVVQTFDLIGSGQRIDESAYSAIFVTIQVAGIVLAVAGVGAALVLAWLRQVTGWEEATRLAALFWWYFGVAWLALWVTLYVAPRMA